MGSDGGLTKSRESSNAPGNNSVQRCTRYFKEFHFFLISTATIFADVFDNSMDVSDDDLITLPRRSSRLVKSLTQKGIHRSVRKKKVVVDDSIDEGSCGNLGSEYMTTNELKEDKESTDKEALSGGGKQIGTGGHSTPPLDTLAKG